MDIEYPPFVGAQKHFGHYPHIAGKADKVHLPPFQFAQDLCLVAALALIVTGREDKTLNSHPAGLFYNRGAGTVTDHQYNPGIQPSVTASLGYSLEIASFSACEYGQSHHFITMSTPGREVTSPITLAFSPKPSSISIALGACSAGSTSTIPIPILKMLNISR